jgi:hypothetical protein
MTAAALHAGAIKRKVMLAKPPLHADVQHRLDQLTSSGVPDLLALLLPPPYHTTTMLL